MLVPFVSGEKMPSFNIPEDDVVRKDNFRPDSENISDMLMSGGASPTSGQFDFEGGKKEASFDDLEKVPSELIYLREGRLNITERKVLQNKLRSDLQSEADKSVIDNAEKVRQARVDNILGIESDVGSA